MRTTGHHPAAQAAATPTPLLLPHLRDALSCLYSLPRYAQSPHGFSRQSRASHERDAHAFLLDFRGRNVRRKRKSAEQSRRDASAAAGSPSVKHNRATGCVSSNETGGVDFAEMGSAWLACSVLLSLPDAHSAERLFAAQTLLHRLRRFKLVEAVDSEIEDPARTVPSVPGRSAVEVWGEHARAWYCEVGGVHPLVHRLLGGYCATASSPADEERTKGELALLNVAALLHITASAATATGASGDGDNAGPVLSALGSALAVAALRFKFCGGSSASTAPSLVNIVIHSVSTASDAALAQDSRLSSQATDLSANSAIRSRVVCSCLSSLPDALFGSPGGARGRLSVDPKWLQSACGELRDPVRGLGPFRDALVDAAAASLPISTEAEAEFDSHTRVLQACERWAKFVPLPLDFVEGTVLLAARYLSASNHTQSPQSSTSPVRSAAYAYLITLFEGAALTLAQVLAMAVGLAPESADATHQMGRRKQSSKSKKRHKERLHAAVHENNAADVRRRCAEEEVRCRGDVACRAAALVWEGGACGGGGGIGAEGVRGGGLRVAMTEALVRGGELASDGEGPVGCACSCASACLPHLLRRRGNSDGETAAFFASVTRALRAVCSHPERSVRALSYGPLAAIHAALGTSGINSATLGSIAIDGIYESSMALAASCRYPAGYFDDLSLDNDDDLENERDDLRNVLRSVTDLERQEVVSEMDSSASILILRRVLGACAEAVSSKDLTGDNTSPIVLPPETAVHALSALAKPLNRLGEAVVGGGNGGGASASELLVVALRCLGDVAAALLRVFESPSAQDSSLAAETFVVSRLSCLTTTSYAPLFSSLVSASEAGTFRDGAVLSECRRALSLSIGAAIASASALPELAFESSLDGGCSMFDIRGAMRGPGGEDHVGCIAVNRLSVESECLTQNMLTLPLPYPSRNGGGSGGGGGGGGDPVGRPNALLLDLCRLHDELKASELARGPGVHHGVGVAPKSRRIVLGTVSRLSLLVLDGSIATVEAADDVRAKLQDLFHGPVEIVAASAGAGAGMSDAEKYFRICEAVLDLASFSSEVSSSLFSPNSHEQVPLFRECAQGIVESLVTGYSVPSSSSASTSIPDARCIQWGRLRAAVFSLMKASANPGLTPLAAEAITAVNQAECAAVILQCNAGRESTSSIFHDSVVGEEVLPAGAYLMVISEVLDNIMAAAKSKMITDKQLRDESHGCVHALSCSMNSVIAALASRSPEADAHVDPRPTLAEAWYLSMKSLASLFKAAPQSMYSSEETKHLIVESFVLSIRFLLSRGVEEGGRKSVHAAGMSLDGPQTFAILAFMELLLSFGPEILELTPHFVQKEIMIDAPQMSEASASSVPPALVGGAIIGAALFRGSSGVLPPWAVEEYPSLFSSFFFACGRNTDCFCQIVSLACDLQLAGTDSFGELHPGHKLAGRYFNNLSTTARDLFLSQSREICCTDSETSWRRFKVVIKQACGGKKKASGFNQKPSVTNWECERV